MQLENVNQRGLLSKNSLCNHLLEDAFAAPDPTGLSWGQGHSKQNQEHHGPGEGPPLCSLQG